MIDGDDIPGVRIHSIAAKAVDNYAQDILSANVLAERMREDWESRRIGEEEPSDSVLARIAQRICSSELYAAWRSPEQELRDRAFANLRRYLTSTLQRSPYASALAKHAIALEDVVQQALTELFAMLARGTYAGPHDAAAFLKWTQTIVLRYAYALVAKYEHETVTSLDDSVGDFTEQFVDNNTDLQEEVIQKELHQELKNVILSLKNQRYRQVLLYTFLAGMDESELASLLGVRVQEVYMWRHRALKALRRKPEVMRILKPWLR